MLKTCKLQRCWQLTGPTFPSPEETEKQLRLLNSLNPLLLQYFSILASWRKLIVSLKALLLFLQTNHVIWAQDFVAQITSTSVAVGNPFLPSLEVVPHGSVSTMENERSTTRNLTGKDGMYLQYF